MSKRKSQSAEPSAIPNAAPQAAPASAKKANGNGVSHIAHPLRPSSEAIAHRAHEKFIERGSEHGLDQHDWIAAELELTAESRTS